MDSDTLPALADQLFHHGSHQDLLFRPDEPPRIQHRVDAIIVPTSRSIEHLEDIARQAITLDCPLVTLHSGASTAAAAADHLPTAVDLIAIDMPEPGSLRLPSLKTSKLIEGTAFALRSDLSGKRNLALALSRLRGWSRIFFIDDDIELLSPDDVRRAAGLLDEYTAVGLHVGDFADNSVVCHAYRVIGGTQKSFVGGGALAVDVRSCLSFFPDIYNSDWFFLLDEDRRLQPTAMTGQAIQLPYDPFLNPERARSEELGEVLAEGLYWLLDKGKSIKDANEAHWDEVLDRRRTFIEVILAVLPDDDVPAQAAERRRAALEAAWDQLAMITTKLCEDYLAAWLADRMKWRRYLLSLPQDLSVQRSLAKLLR